MTEIRPARHSDIDAVVALEAAIFVEEAWSPRSVEAEFEQRGVSRAIDIAVHGSEVIGYAVLMYAGGSGDVTRIVVAEAYRRRGVASLLLGALVERASTLGLDQIMLEVSHDNVAAVSLYRRHGFEEIDRRPGYYAGRRDALVMRRSASSPAVRVKRSSDG